MLSRVLLPYNAYLYKTPIVSSKKYFAMKKTLRKMTLAGLLFAFSLTMTGCFGSFQLTRSVYQWNESVTPNKFAQTLLFYGMNVVPVYGAAGFLDFFVFNLVEFWSGSNPMAMAEGEHETQLVYLDGDWYEMEAAKNQFVVSKVNHDTAELLYAIEFDEMTQQFVVRDKRQED